MPRPLTTPAVIFASQQHRGEGSPLTVRKARAIAEEGIVTIAGVPLSVAQSHHCTAAMGASCPICVRRGQLLAHAADSLLRGKRSRAKGHPNGRRNYSGKDRRGVPAAGSARVHGARPGTAVSVPKVPARNERTEAC